MNIEQISEKLESFRKKRTMPFIIAAGILMAVSFVMQYWYSYNDIRKEVQNWAESELRAKKLEVQKVVTAVETASMSTIWMIEDRLSDPQSLNEVLQSMLKKNPGITGCGIGFVADYYPQHGHWFEPYADRLPDGSIELLEIGSESHDYLSADWFTYPIETGNGFWTEPYFDEAGGKTLMITYAQPVHDSKGRVVGVFGTDVSLEWINTVLNAHHIYPSSYNVMVSRNGNMIACPDEGLVMRKSLEEVTARLEDTTISKLNRDMLAGRTGYATIKDNNGKKNYVFFTPVGHDTLLNNEGDKLGWSMAVVCSHNDIYGDLRSSGTRQFLFIILALSLLYYILSRSIRGFNSLETVNAEKERIKGELSVAHNIQQAMLPKALADNTEDAGFDICASLTPAREVGGDFYDFYLRDGKLFFCIGDVSGKGVPSALVMAMARSTFRALSGQMSSPENVITAMNDSMSSENEYNMFITLFMGVLDLSTGRLRYCNAGHCAPVIDKTLLKVVPNLPIGAMPGWVFTEQETTIPSGSTIFLYTDGLTEAENANHILFGKDRMLNSIQLSTPRKLIAKMTADVDAFVGDTEQSDDLTMLAIKYTLRKPDISFHSSIVLPNNVSYTPQLADFVDSACETVGIGTSETMQTNLAIEEAVVNVINYAYPAGTNGDVTVTAETENLEGQDVLKFIITDSGKAFDPTAHKEVDTTLSAEEREIGGLGIHLIRKYMDIVNYERIDGQNILTLIKRIDKQ